LKRLRVFEGLAMTQMPAINIWTAFPLVNASGVELRGFEPLTPSMRTRCATGLRYSPEDLSGGGGHRTKPATSRRQP
jgi:hypothetical protein